MRKMAWQTMEKNAPAGGAAAMDTDAASDALKTVAISMWFSAPSGARSHRPMEHQTRRTTEENETCHDARARISASVSTGWRSRRNAVACRTTAVTVTASHQVMRVFQSIQSAQASWTAKAAI